MKRGGKYQADKYHHAVLFNQAYLKSKLILDTEKERIANLTQPGKPLSASNIQHFIDCPPKQFPHCCFYKFARHSDDMASLAEAFHSGKLADKSPPNDDLTNERLARFPLWIIADCPEFLHTPWLDLPADRREKLAKRTRPTFRSPAPPAFRDRNPSQGVAMLQSQIETLRLAPELASKLLSLNHCS